jgi:CubicO group peptidase (beta-lactamase class C family)
MKNRFALLISAAAMAYGQLGKTNPAEVGLDSVRLERASALLETETREQRVGAASLIVVRHGRIAFHRGYGKLSPKPDAPAVTPDIVFLLASITKPVTITALMMLVERGLVSIEDPAHLYLSELQHRQIKVRDLMAHTSGLPDMLPENTELRRAHAPLSEFVKRAMTTPLVFPTASDFRYQSMGTLLAGEIVERVSKMRLRDFEQKEIFAPLGMKASSLGLGGRKIEDTAWCQGGGDPADLSRFGANSPYWRDMGHPWGGMHSTTRDLAVLLQTFLNGGEYAGYRLLSPKTVSRMTTDQNGSLGKPWGLGWGLANSPVWAYFGDIVSRETFGHSGATGTVAWADPVSKLVCVILTTRPSGEDQGRLLRSVSNAVAASVVK